MSCVFSTSDPLRSAQRKNTPNPYAILIAVNQSNDKRSWTVKEKANCTIPGPKNPKPPQFSAKNCNRRQEILKQNDLSDTSKHTPNRVESPLTYIVPQKPRQPPRKGHLAARNRNPALNQPSARPRQQTICGTGEPCAPILRGPWLRSRQRPEVDKCAQPRDLP